MHIPQFMKNDLDKLEDQNEKKEDQVNFQDQFNIGSQCKIRRSIYYIVARGIKFGFDVQFLMQECRLADRLMRDISLFERNHFIFQNILMVVHNLTLDK